MLPPKTLCKSFPQCERHSALLRTVAVGCGRNGCGRYDNESRTRLHPQTPRVKREPFATHSGKPEGQEDALLIFPYPSCSPLWCYQVLTQHYPTTTH